MGDAADASGETLHFRTAFLANSPRNLIQSEAAVVLQVDVPLSTEIIVRLLHGLKRPFRIRWVRRVVVGTTAVFLLGIAYLVVDREVERSAGHRELAQAVAAADLSDLDWRWDDLNKAREKPPEGKNSADVIDRARAASPKDWFFPEVPDSVIPNHKDTDEAIAEIRRQLALAPEAVRLARTLRDYPWGYREAVLDPNDYFSTYAEATQNARWVAAALNWDSRLALADGEFSQVSDNVLACLNVSRSIGDDPDSIAQIIRVSMRGNATLRLERALARTGSLPRLAELQSAWAADAEEPLLYHVMRGKRALYDRIFEGIENGTFPLDAFFDKKDGFLGRTRSGLPSNRATILRRMTARVVAAKLPVEQQGAAFARDPWPDHPPNQLMGILQFGAMAYRFESHWRSTAKMRCAIAGLACERFRLLKGRWPESLQEIPAELLAAVPLDPFDGKPLRYRQLPDGVAIYSVGVNGSDDGGDLHWGERESLDVGFRLWNASARNLPPLPPAPKDEAP